jgi:hypothetical protein
VPLVEAGVSLLGEPLEELGLELELEVRDQHPEVRVPLLALAPSLGAGHVPRQ